MIPTEALQVLDAIDRKGSFAAAAEELFKVPSAISYTIQKLEEQLGVTLFDRQKQRAKLTTTGRLVLERGRDILHQMQQLEQQATLADSGWETQLRITVDTLLPYKPLWPLITELQAQHPWLTVRLREEALSGSWEALLADQADMVIGVTSDAPQGWRWHRQPLGVMSFQAVCSTEHPASRLPTPIDTKQLRRFTHIIINDSARNLPVRNVGLLGSQQYLCVNNMSQKYEALLAGMGISHLPHYLAQPAIEAGLLSPLILQAPTLPQSLFMAWPKENTGKACQWLREQLLKRQILAPYIAPPNV